MYIQKYYSMILSQCYYKSSNSHHTLFCMINFEKVGKKLKANKKEVCKNSVKKVFSYLSIKIDITPLSFLFLKSSTNIILIKNRHAESFNKYQPEKHIDK